MNEVGENGYPDAAAMQKLDRMLRIAWSKLRSGETVAAAAAFNEVAQEAARAFPPGSVQLAHFLNEVGVGLFMVGPSYAHGSLAHLSQALKLFAGLKGTASLECGRIHRQLSAIYASSGMHQRAIASLRRAAEIFEALVSSDLGEESGPVPVARNQQLMKRMEEFANARAGFQGMPVRTNVPAMG
jgi:hypothetical protein